MSAEQPAGGRAAASTPLLGRAAEPTIFELSQPGRRCAQLRTTGVPEWGIEELVPADHRRNDPLSVAEVSERDLVAHFTRLSHRQFSVDLGAYPLGSCTMKYNPKFCDEVAGLAGLSDVHPAAPAPLVQGWLALMVELEEALCEITGMAAATVQPAAGAAGELTGLLLMRAFHGRAARSAGGWSSPTRPTAPTRPRSPWAATRSRPSPPTTGAAWTWGRCAPVLDTDVAGIMLTNPNTLGLFEEDIEAMAAATHEVGGLLYYDGANLNAILGVVRPGDMGFDIVHLNLHKTFATPHGGGGPGAGPVAVSDRLVEYLPGPRAVRRDGAGGPAYGWATPARSIGRVHSWHGNALVLARALAYIEVHGGDGLRRVAERAVLNANWLRARLSGVYDVPFDRPCMHEVVLSAATLKRRHGVKALDVAKRLLEEGFHAPTVYFPLIVDEALMIEPTETESPQTLAALADALERIAEEASSPDGPAAAAAAPRTTPVSRVDEARAARTLVPTFDARGD